VPVDFVSKGDMMGESECSIQTARASARAELVWWENFADVYVMSYSFGNGFFHELAQAVEKQDGAVRFRGKVVRFAWFGNNLHKGPLPQGGVEHVCKAAIEEHSDV